MYSHLCFVITHSFIYEQEVPNVELCSSNDTSSVWILVNVSLLLEFVGFITVNMSFSSWIYKMLSLSNYCIVRLYTSVKCILTISSNFLLENIFCLLFFFDKLFSIILQTFSFIICLKGNDRNLVFHMISSEINCIYFHLFYGTRYKVTIKA